MGYILLLGLCLVLAYLSWRYVELPFRKPARAPVGSFLP